MADHSTHEPADRETRILRLLTLRVQPRSTADDGALGLQADRPPVVDTLVSEDRQVFSELQRRFNLAEQVGDTVAMEQARDELSLYSWSAAAADRAAIKAIDTDAAAGTAEVEAVVAGLKALKKALKEQTGHLQALTAATELLVKLRGHLT